MAKTKLIYLRPQDKDVAEFLESLPNISEWVRSRARAEIARRSGQIDPELVAIIERLIDKKLAGRTVMNSGLAVAQESVNVDLEQFF